MKPIEHARSSAKIFGGKFQDYMPIHEFLDSSKSGFSDLRHRALTHNAWFLTTILERVYGPILVNSHGQGISVRAIGEQHVLEDFRGKFIPSAQDYLAEIEFQPWMDNGKGEPPPSRRKAKNLVKAAKTEKRRKILDAMGDIEAGLGRGRGCGGDGMLD
jgi:hypothetical protein